MQTDEAPSPPTKHRPAWQESIVGCLFLGAVIGGCAVLHILVWHGPLNTAAKAFLTAVRADRLVEARGYATREFQQYLPEHGAELPPSIRDAEPSRTLALVIASTKVDTGDITRDWSSGCVWVHIDGDRQIWLRMRKVDGAWRVINLQSDAMPDDCRIDTGGD